MIDSKVRHLSALSSVDQAASLADISHFDALMLRAMDIAVAMIALLLCLPQAMLLMPGGRLVRTSVLGWHGVPFSLLSWALAPGWREKLGCALGLHRLPLVINLLRGDMALVGPRPLGVADVMPEAGIARLRAAIKPGVFSLWDLRRRTSIDYGSAMAADIEQVKHHGLRHDMGILVRSILASLYGTHRQGPKHARVLVDTLIVESINMDETLARIETVLDQNASSDTQACQQLCFVNPDCVNIARRDPKYRAVVNQADIVVPDGIGMKLAGRMLGHAFRQNVNGTDLFPRLCEQLARRSGRVFLLGARPDVARLAADWIAVNHPGVQVVGAEHGYFGADETDALLARIRAARPDVLLVAMGAPMQDVWIAEHASATGAKIAMGVGGLFDFVAGRIPRAPQWLRELGLEWAYRLLQEPGRMWRRYLLGNVSFVMAVALQRWLGSPSPELLASHAVEEATICAAERAIILALSGDSDEWIAHAGHCASLLPLGDRPMLARNLETLAGNGCKEVDLYAACDLGSMRKLVGDGARWGMKVRVHAVRDLKDATRRILKLELPESAPVWLCRADYYLPTGVLRDAEPGCVWMNTSADDEHKTEWCGWACVAPNQLPILLGALGAKKSFSSNDNFEGMSLGACLPAAFQRVESPPAWRFDSAAAVLASQKRWLARDLDRFEVLSQRANDVRVAATARIAADAVLTGPVEIGEGVFIGQGARVGPNVVLGAHSYIEGGAVVSNALVDEGVFVASLAELVQAVAVSSGVFNVAHQVWLSSDMTANLVGATSWCGRKAA